MTTTRRQALQLGGLAGAALVGGLTGCGFKGTTGQDSGSGATSLTIQGPVLPTFDPHVISNGMWMVVRALLEGLLLQTDDGTDVQAGAAESWEVSDDGTVYTFNLREAKWSDGSPLTAKDFEFAYQRLLSPKSTGAGISQGANSYVTSLNIKNALEFQGGAVEWDEVGVKIPDDRTVEFTLASPNIGFLMGLTHASMVPLPAAVVEAEKADWEKPGTMITNGPFTLTGLQPNVSMGMQKNEHYWDADNVALDQVDYRMYDGADESLVPFENGEVDIMPVGASAATLLRFQNEPALQGQLKSAKPGTIFYLALLHSKNPVLSDVRIREALSLAMGRDLVAQSQPMITPALSLVPESLPDWDPSLALTEDVEKARQLLSDAGHPGGKGLPQITILNGGAASPLLATIQSNWQKNLGVKVKTDVVEYGVYATKRFALNDEDYVGYYFGSYAAELNWAKWVASLWSPSFAKPFSLSPQDYQKYLELQEGSTDLKPADLAAKLNELATSKASPQVKEFDALTEKAMATVDPEAAVATFKEAAAVREETRLFLPIAQAAYHFAVNPRVTGFHPRPTGDQYYYRTLGVEES